tara:strand:- start:6813 stop:8102 length:1290 start_codon:yes stop_codon:yes gene_type:complete
MKNLQHNAIGSLTQLAAVGPQDLHLHYGNEDTKASAFKFESKYSQHTKFGIDISNTYQVRLRYGDKHVFDVPFQKQHMISNITLKVKFPDISMAYDKSRSTGIHYANKLGYRLLKKVSFKLDGQVIESFTGQYLYILHKLETTESHREGLEMMTGMSECESLLNGDARTLYIPLPLWYARTMKQFFPLFTLKRQSLKIVIELESIENLIECENEENVVDVSTTSQNGRVKIQCNPAHSHTIIESVIDAEYYIDYIVVDDIERNVYLEKNQTHVYNTVLYQTEKLKNDTSKILMHFNIPVKQLIFVFTDNNDMFKFYKFTSARLIFGKSANDLMNKFSSDYYTLLQDYYHNKCHAYNENIHSYSFALNASVSEHNGAIHLGQMTSKILDMNGPFIKDDGTEIKNVSIHIYARGYNVFHIQEGYGSIEFKA